MLFDIEGMQLNFFAGRAEKAVRPARTNENWKAWQYRPEEQFIVKERSFEPWSVREWNGVTPGNSTQTKSQGLLLDRGPRVNLGPSYTPWRRFSFLFNPQAKLNRISLSSFPSSWIIKDNMCAELKSIFSSTGMFFFEREWTRIKAIDIIEEASGKRPQYHGDWRRKGHSSREIRWRVTGGVNQRECDS